MEPFVPGATAPAPKNGAARAAFLQAALTGLRRRPRSLPCRYFYDARGSELFEAICRTPEYYLTRAELDVLARHGAEIAASLGSGVTLVELGSGSARKTRLLLEQLTAPAAYVPVDISSAALQQSAVRHRRDFPHVPLHPVCADFAERFVLPPAVRAAAPGSLAVFFPGSTIGNFEPSLAAALMGRVARLVGPGGAFLVGIDVQKDPALMEAAYNDAAGVTAAFNANVLVRLRDELGADVHPEDFAHRAVWNPRSEAIESFLVSRRAQDFILSGERIALAAGEAIHTESSYKYRPEAFDSLAADAGLVLQAAWTDAERLFSVRLLRAVETPIPSERDP